ncbi:MAG: tetratricopeptide repeat protein [Pyrinomonadaceae bacterium]
MFSAVDIEVNAQSKKPSDKAKKLAKQGDRFFQNKDYRNAVNKYAEAVILSPEFASAHFWKGYAHYNLKEIDQSIGDLNAAFEQGYKPLDVYKLRWYAFYEKNYDLALKDVREVLKLEPANKELNIAIGNIYRSQKAFQEALDAYQKVVELDPNNRDVHYFIALSHFNLNNFLLQGAAAAEAIKRNTQFIGESYYLLGDSLQKAKKPVEAIQAYEKALNVKADILEVYNNLAELYGSQNHFNKVIDTIKKGLHLFPDEGNLYVSLSWYYNLNDQPAQAVVAAQNAVKLLPEQAAGHTNLCRAYNDLKDYQLAVSACGNALRINPSDGETSFYLGRAYDLLSKPDEATKYYKQAVSGLEEFTRNKPSNPDGFYLLGNAFYADNQTEKAIEAYKKALELNPGFARAHYNLGYIYFLKKDMASALEKYDVLLKINAGLAEKFKKAIEKR